MSMLLKMWRFLLCLQNAGLAGICVKNTQRTEVSLYCGDKKIRKWKRDTEIKSAFSLQGKVAWYFNNYV